MQSHARVVVVGGGCVGANILYSLAHRGWTDVCLLERTELTAGSTWHAAGLIPVYSFSYKFGRLIQKTIDLYEGLEAETGQSIGWHKCGQLRIAESADRMDEYLNYASIAQTQGIHAEILTPEQTVDLWPLMQRSPQLLGAVYNRDDGHIAPADVTQALAKGAKQLGAKIYLNTQVNSIDALPSGEWRVSSNQGDIVCEHVVTATGNYVQQTAHMLGLDLPCFPILHQYWVTETVPEVRARKDQGLPEMPVLRNEAINGYVREERDGLMFGPYERPGKLEHFAPMVYRNGSAPICCLKTWKQSKTTGPPHSTWCPCWAKSESRLTCAVRSAPHPITCRCAGPPGVNTTCGWLKALPADG